MIHMDVDIETLAKYPMESDDWLITVLLGGAMLLFSWLLVPLFVVQGYLIRALRAGMDGASEPPVFDEWGELLKEGLIASVIMFVYQLIPTIVFFVMVGGSFLAMFSGSNAGAGLGIFAFMGSFALYGVLALVFSFVGFAGVANYAKEETIGAGFDFGVITTALTARDYIVAWLIAVACYLVAGAISSVIPLVGWIAAPFLTFYALIVAGWLLGDGFASATGMQTGGSVDDDAVAV